MDWLDTYLDGLAQYKTTVSPCDTHIWGEKPNLNNQQKRMLFDAAAQSELEYRLIVQEARQAEINAGMGGSYDAGSAARERPATPAAPSGIPVTGASQPLVINFGSGDPRNGTYLGNSTEWANNAFSTNYKLIAPGVRSNATWTFFDDDNFVQDSPSNPSTNPNFIPTSGWIDPSITITAA